MRCYITILACGWLLFTPPRGWNIEYLSNPDVNFDQVLNQIPLEKWDFQRGFDTAEACYQYARDSQDVGERLAKRARGKAFRGQTLSEDDISSLAYAGRMTLKYAFVKCVPSEVLGFKLE